MIPSLHPFSLISINVSPSRYPTLLLPFNWYPFPDIPLLGCTTQAYHLAGIFWQRVCVSARWYAAIGSLLLIQASHTNKVIHDERCWNILHITKAVCGERYRNILHTNKVISNKRHRDILHTNKAISNKRHRDIPHTYKAISDERYRDIPHTNKLISDERYRNVRIPIL